MYEGFAVSVAFNRRGTLLAAGCGDGRITVYDLVTKGPVLSLAHHVGSVGSVSFSRSGRKLLSGSADWDVVLWDLGEGEMEAKLHLSGPLLSAAMHPVHNRLALVFPLGGPPGMVSFARRPHSGSPGSASFFPLPSLGGGESDTVAAAVVLAPGGRWVFVGTSDGKLVRVPLVVADGEVTYGPVEEVAEVGAGVRGMVLSGDGKRVLVNCTDRVIRMYGVANGGTLDGDAKVDLEFLHRYEDLVNKLSWSALAFSSDGEYVLGSSGESSQHNIYVWDVLLGTLVKILEGPKEGILSFAWHPLRPVIASTSSMGVVYMWGTHMTQNWSAYAPDFEELEENAAYLEREDEFDELSDAERAAAKAAAAAQADALEEAMVVDVITRDRLPFETDSDMEYMDSDGLPELTHVPVDPIPDLVFKARIPFPSPAGPLLAPSIPTLDEERRALAEARAAAVANTHLGPVQPALVAAPVDSGVKRKRSGGGGSKAKKGSKSKGSQKSGKKGGKKGSQKGGKKGSQKGTKGPKGTTKRKKKLDATAAVVEVAVPDPKPDGWDSWSTAKKKSYLVRGENPNTFYYRHVSPGLTQATGKWTAEEHEQFMVGFSEMGPEITQWGVFSKHVPSRVGYQCRAHYVRLVKDGRLPGVAPPNASSDSPKAAKEDDGVKTMDLE